MYTHRSGLPLRSSAAAESNPLAPALAPSLIPSLTNMVKHTML